ncbi:MAG: hypothetical protein M0P69_17515 [Bacteroidales bacterium]|nr:hypothetical protein [Bacteroidales bacterium]
MQVKTPRHDALLEMLSQGKYGWKTYFEEAIQLAETLEFENIALQAQIEELKNCNNCSDTACKIADIYGNNSHS